MNNKDNNGAKILTIVVCLLVAFQIIRSCDTSPSTDDPEMSRMSID